MWHRLPKTFYFGNWACNPVETKFTKSILEKLSSKLGRICKEVKIESVNQGLDSPLWYNQNLLNSSDICIRDWYNKGIIQCI